jgi:hypothetical protein
MHGRNLRSLGIPSALFAKPVLPLHAQPRFYTTPCAHRHSFIYDSYVSTPQPTLPPIVRAYCGRVPDKKSAEDVLALSGLVVFECRQTQMMYYMVAVLGQQSNRKRTRRE